MRAAITVTWVLIALACGAPDPEPSSEASSGSEATAPATTSDNPPSQASASSAEPAAEAPSEEESPAALVPAHGPLSEEDLHRGVLARLRDPRRPACSVSALPAQLRRRTTAEPNLREVVSFELPEHPVTAWRQGERQALVYRSARLDPASEVGDLGYRLRVRDGGEEHDLAMGLTARRPLVLVHNPMVPLLEGDVVQIEARLEAIDDASIDFVPAEGMSTVRSERELLVRCPLEDLRRDQDRDGLTDLEEERLLTDLWDPDTDGDGTRDGEDRSPLGAAAAGSPSDQIWLAADREIVRGASADGLVVAVRGAARLEVGGDHPGLVLILREDELGLYQRRFGLRAPLVIAVTMRGESRARVDVDSVWAQSHHDAARGADGRWSFTPARR